MDARDGIKETTGRTCPPGDYSPDSGPGTVRVGQEVTWPNRKESEDGGQYLNKPRRGWAKGQKRHLKWQRKLSSSQRGLPVGGGFRNIAKRSVRECDTAAVLWEVEPSASPIGPCKDCKQS